MYLFIQVTDNRADTIYNVVHNSKHLHQ